MYENQAPKSLSSCKYPKRKQFYNRALFTCQVFCDTFHFLVCLFLFCFVLFLFFVFIIIFFFFFFGGGEEGVVCLLICLCLLVFCFVLFYFVLFLLATNQTNIYIYIYISRGIPICKCILM